MSSMLIDNEELKQSKDITDFLKALSPQMQEKIKTIILWESLKRTENEHKGA